MQQASKILAFSAQKLIAEGSFSEVIQLVKNHIKHNDTGNTLFFNGSDGRQIDINLQAQAVRRLRIQAVVRTNPVKSPGGVPNWVWWAVKSPCCRDTGNGWMTSVAGPRRGCGGLSTRSARPTRERTGFASLRTVPTASCMPWRAIFPALKRR